MSTRVTSQDLRNWRAVINPSGPGWCVLDESNAPMLGGLTQQAAVLIAAAPRLLRFVASFRSNAPVAADVNALLARCDIEIERPS